MSKVRVAIMASGEGSNARALILHERTKPECSFTIACIITNKRDAGVVQVAEHFGIPCFMIPFVKRDEKDIVSELSGILKMQNIEFICLAGFLKKIPGAITEVFKQKIINIHPSLLPAFGGHGMFGRNVFDAVLKAGVRVTGVTVHRVSEEYDEGAGIFREEISVDDDETVESLSRKTKEVEHRIYPEVLEAECARFGQKS